VELIAIIYCFSCCCFQSIQSIKHSQQTYYSDPNIVVCAVAAAVVCAVAAAVAAALLLLALLFILMCW
jgi:hypothetical protein